MGIKDLLNKGKCLIGLHQGEWRAASPTSCSFTRICERCKAEHQKVEHTWAEWGFVADTSCDQTRTCRRCAHHEERVSHAWGEPAYTEEGRCERQQTCARCHEVKAAAAKHVMDGWRHLGGDVCTHVQQCSRCGADGAKQRVEHVWADWQHSNAHNGPVRVCRRCGEMQVQPQTVPAAGSTPAQAPPPAPPARDKTRQELFDALKPKMQQLAEQQAAMARVLGTMGDAAEARLAQEGHSPAAARSDSVTPPTFTDDEVADLITRAEEAARDTRLVGHWLCHPPALSSGGYSLSTDYHLVLDDEGRFARWSYSVGPMGPMESEREYGAWSDGNGTLVLKYDDGAESVRTYEVHARDLLFHGGGSQAYWQRVR